jgi:hypothetical protein
MCKRQRGYKLAADMQGLGSAKLRYGYENKDPGDYAERRLDQRKGSGRAGKECINQGMIRLMDFGMRSCCTISINSAPIRKF